MANTKSNKVAELIAGLPKQDSWIISKFENGVFAERLSYANYDEFAVAVQDLHAKGYKISQDLSQDTKVNANLR